MRRGITVLFVMLALTIPVSAREKRGKGLAKDGEPPKVVLTVPDPAPSTFPISVKAEDRSGVSKVFISLEGEILGGRVEPPFDFLLTVDQFPVEVCAVADDLAGNSGRDCKVVHTAEPPDCFEDAVCADGEYCAKPDGECDGLGICHQIPAGDCFALWEPVCGCDGQTHSNDCYAASHGVSVVYDGECE